MVARGEIEWSVALREAAEVRIFSCSYKREKREREREFFFIFSPFLNQISILGRF
jgi:hypothetical protein